MDQAALIEDLDSRQNDVMDRLAQLNAKIETLLSDCLAVRDRVVQGIESGRPLDSRAPTSA